MTGPAPEENEVVIFYGIKDILKMDTNLYVHRSGDVRTERINIATEKEELGSYRINPQEVFSLAERLLEAMEGLPEEVTWHGDLDESWDRKTINVHYKGQNKSVQWLYDPPAEETPDKIKDLEKELESLHTKSVG